MMRNFKQCLSDNPLMYQQPLWVSGLGFYRSLERKKMRNFHPIRAVDRDSDAEFEFDPDLAREALRKLDQQLDRMSQKQINPLPKNKVPSPYDTRVEATKDLPADTGSFLPYAFFGLLIFTIVYNIVFIKIIKPSIDGQVELSPVRPSIMRDILKSEVLSVLSSIQLPPSAEIVLMAYNTSRPEAWDDFQHRKPKKKRSLWCKFTNVFGCKKIERSEVEDPSRTPTRYSKMGPSFNSSISPSPLLLRPSLRSPIRRRYG